MDGLDGETFFTHGCVGYTYDDVAILPGHMDFGRTSIIAERGKERRM